MQFYKNPTNTSFEGRETNLQSTQIYEKIKKFKIERNGIGIIMVPDTDWYFNSARWPSSTETLNINTNFSLVFLNRRLKNKTKVTEEQRKNNKKPKGRH